jgi:glycosyltransferase involved in cell wall biosynthesis
MRKNLLLIGSFPPPYHGANIDNENIVQNWNSKILNLHTLDISNKNKRFWEFGGKITFGNIFTALKAWFKLLILLPKWEFDYVLCHLSQRFLGLLKDGLIIITIKLFTNSKVNCRFPAGYFIVTKSKLYKNNAICRYIVKYILTSIDQIITEGDCVNKEFFNIDSTLNVNSVHIGIPDHSYSGYKIPNDRIEVLYIANHCKMKGFWDVIFSTPKIVESNPNIFFNFVGYLRFDKHELRKIDKFIIKNNLSNNIIFHGIKINEEKDFLFKNATIQILPSYLEGMPTSIMEGLSYGLPIIASKVGVIPEVIKNGENGFLIDPGDRDGLVKNILELAKNRELANQISKNNRNYFLQYFTIEKFCQRLEKVIIASK